ncbi:MAG: adenylate kinase [Chloroflexi bacterium]|nr:adenylate kinase [Chloroflexota bacterium]
MYVVLLGPPGAGKGTQAQAISQELKLAHISSGDIFRENLKKETELGKLAKGYMDRGELVPDDVTISMIEERLSRPDCAEGALLDGFPRTPAQAEALSVMLAKQGKQIDVVPLITVPAEVLVERLSGRWTCPTCGYVYHSVFNPPKQAGVCDADGAALYQREDDKPETVKNRIRVYEAQTAPLIEYYQKRNLLAEVDGTQPIENVTKSLLEVIKKVS